MFETQLAGIRFGYGFGPHSPPVTRAELVAGLASPDRMAERYPGLGLQAALQLGREFRAANLDVQRGADGADARYETARAALRGAVTAGLRIAFARIAETDTPLRERLTWFWADHFTSVPQNALMRAAGMSFIDEAIRPHISGSFAQMLKAVIRHPSMLIYLDQHLSVGPESRAAARTGRGLNENLARELLELHTMGVGSGYTQADVRAAAELLTGLAFHPDEGFVFRPNAAQPGPETVLGESYGSDRRARIGDIDDFLGDLALRPETAGHLARKMAVHFQATRPDEGLVSDMAAAYRGSDGDLGQMVRVLMTHPETAAPPLRKVKTPFDFIGSAMVALGVRGNEIEGFSTGDLRRLFIGPLVRMGQPFMRAPGPDGWSEDPAHWITPQGLANRISWAVAIADLIGPRIDDPRAFLERTLGAVSGERLRFAVSAAETHAEGLALVLASAEFNRR